MQKSYCGSRIVTLGPKGTDSEAVAIKLTDEVLLVESFVAAMEHAKQNNILALISCGYVGQEGGWVDLNFRYYREMRIKECFVSETKKMCVAVRHGIDRPKTVIIHPATKEFIRPYGNLELHYVGSKPEAVRLAAGGTYDMCIGSVDVVSAFRNLRILEEFAPQMVWSIYERV